MLLFSSLVPKCTAYYNRDRHLDVIKVSITVLLYGLSKLKPPAREDKFIDVFSECEKALKDVAVKVIGGSFFGGTIQKSQLITATKELEVGPLSLKQTLLLLHHLPCLQLWQSFLELETPEDPKVTERWNKAVENAMKKRVEAVCTYIYNAHNRLF